MKLDPRVVFQDAPRAELSTPLLPPSTPSSSRARPKSGLINPLLLVLGVSSIMAITSLPLLVGLVFIPIIGLFAVTALVFFAGFLLYSLSWMLYLTLAQQDPPSDVRLPFLPLSPRKHTRVLRFAFFLLSDFYHSNFISLYLDSQLRRLVVLGGKDASTVVKENVRYGEGGRRRLDVYLPVRKPVVEGEEGADTEDGDEQGEPKGAKVVVFVGGANWTWWRKGMGAQVACRLRRLGYVVVVPDLAQWPAAKSPDMVSDMRQVLEWTAERIQYYGGRADQIYVLGYGSGAHISLLTIVQDSVVRSRDDYLNRPIHSPLPISNTSLNYFDSETTATIELSAGIRRCKIWGADAQLPPVAGLILVSGVFDLIKQLRFETSLGIEDISALRRTCGPSTGAILHSCPSHLLFGAKGFIDPALLPPKILIIAGGGGAPQVVPYSQSVLLHSLLTGIGLGDGVRLKLYKEETHLGSLASLMHQTRYSSLILAEIESIIASDVDSTSGRKGVKK